jgi:alpha-1,6-mannosyltransferase
MRVHIPFAPATGIGNLIGLIVSSASYDDLAAGGRITAAAAGLTVIGYLYVTVRTRPLERTIGFGLLAAAILAPVVYPSYLLWGTLCLAPTATGARRDWVIALSCAACVLTPAGLGDRGGQYATWIGLAVIAAVLTPRLIARHRAEAMTRAGLGADG